MSSMTIKKNFFFNDATSVIGGFTFIGLGLLVLFGGTILPDHMVSLQMNAADIREKRFLAAAISFVRLVVGPAMLYLGGVRFHKG